jgi:hypothetical protein
MRPGVPLIAWLMMEHCPAGFAGGQPRWHSASGGLARKAEVRAGGPVDPGQGAPTTASAATITGACSPPSGPRGTMHRVRATWPFVCYGAVHLDGRGGDRLFSPSDSGVRSFRVKLSEMGLVRS